MPIDWGFCCTVEKQNCEYTDFSISFLLACTENIQNSLTYISWYNLAVQLNKVRKVVKNDSFNDSN